MRLGMNKIACVFRLIVILLVAITIYHSVDMSFECQLTQSWSRAFTLEGFFDQIIDAVFFAGVLAAIKSFIRSLQKLLHRTTTWLGLCCVANKNISQIAFSIGGHAPPLV